MPIVAAKQVDQIKSYTVTTRVTSYGFDEDGYVRGVGTVELIDNETGEKEAVRKTTFAESVLKEMTGAQTQNGLIASLKIGVDEDEG